MEHVSRRPRRGDCLTPTSAALLGNALDFIHEDHLREREICAALDRIAGAATPVPEDIVLVTGILADELPLHLRDEEEDLFPLLKRRCESDDEIEKAIGMLKVENKFADEGAPALILVLNGVASGGKALSDKERDRLHRFAAHARRHLIFENAIILPFARLRLTKDDLETLRLRMMARRGWTHPERKPC